MQCVIIGIGGVAKLYARVLQDIDDVKLVAGCCRSKEKGEEFAEVFGCKWYSSYEEMLDTEIIDFAILTTPSGAHLDPALACFARRIHVLCDKPLEITVERCERMILAAEEANVKLGCIFQTRMLDSFLAAHKALAAGRLGNLSLIAGSVPWWRDDAYYGPTRWQGTRELDGGGACMNQGIHTIDAMIGLLQAVIPELNADVNPIVQVSAYIAQRAHDSTDIEVEDTATVSVLLQNGALGQFSAGTSMYPGSSRRLALYGCDGTVEITGDEFSQWAFREKHVGDETMVSSTASKPGAAADPLALEPEPFRRVIAAFAKSLDPEGRPFPMSGREALKSVEVISAIYESAALGKPVFVGSGVQPLSAGYPASTFAERQDPHPQADEQSELSRLRALVSAYEEEAEEYAARGLYLEEAQDALQLACEEIAELRAAAERSAIDEEVPTEPQEPEEEHAPDRGIKWTQVGTTWQNFDDNSDADSMAAQDDISCIDGQAMTEQNKALKKEVEAWAAIAASSQVAAGETQEKLREALMEVADLRKEMEALRAKVPT
jgi:predicted dehydrogenase